MKLKNPGPWCGHLETRKVSLLLGRVCLSALRPCSRIGCRTCRKRRVKCDERQPSCARCERGGFDCEGFGRDLRFVSENSHARWRSRKQEVLRAEAFESRRDSTEKFVIAESDNSNVSSWSKAVSITATKVCPELNYTVFKNEIQIAFTLANLFQWDKRSVAWLGWGYNTCAHNINSEALKALSGVYYGRLHHQSSFENDSLVHYSKTLYGLRKAIKSDDGISLDVLLAAMTASCYEMIASPSHVGMLLHAGGVGRLIELRGPKRHCSLFELQIFSTMRESICIKAMLDRKRCFLEKEEWKTIPWSLHPEEKSMVRWVQDIMCDVPGLFEDYDNLFVSDMSPEKYKLRFESLKANINHHIRLLSDWRALWEQTYPSICHEQAPLFLQSPFSTVLHYQDLEAVNGLMLYNALYIRIAQLGMRLMGSNYDYQQVAIHPEFDCKNRLLKPPGVSLYDAAIEICRSIEYHLSPPHEGAGAFFIIYPLKKANDELLSGSAEQEWLKTMTTNLALKTGFFFSTGVLSLEVL
jgi:hypothetical protein